MAFGYSIGKTKIIMKNLIIVFAALMMAALSSCITDEVGPAGPRGPQGEQGPKGDSGFVFEFEGVNFTAPEFEAFLPFPDNFESLTSDVALVYLLWDVVEVDGEDFEVWRQIPQSIFTEFGLLQYNFDFTTLDVRLFMEADFDMSQLGAIDTDNWIVRVVIVPGDFWSSARLNKQDVSYEEIEEMLGLPEMPVPAAVDKRRK